MDAEIRDVSSTTDHSFQVLITFVVVVFISLHVARRAFCYRDIPWAPRSSICANIRGLRSSRSPEFLLELSRSFVGTAGADSGCFRLNMPLSPLIVVVDATVARLVLLQQEDRRASDFAGAQDGGHAFALCCPVASKLSRNRALPAFTVDRLASVRASCAARFAEATYVLDYLRDEPVDILPIAMRLALVVTSDAVLGYALSEAELDTVVRSLEACQRAHEAATSLNPLRKLRAACDWQVAAARAALIDVSRSMLSHYRARIRGQRGCEDGNLLALIVENRAYASDRQRCADIAMVLSASAGVASAICWSLYDLAAHPAEQQRVREDLLHCLPPKSLVLAAAVHESMRRNPTSPSLWRTTSKPVPLKNGGHIPSGARVLIPTMALHRSVNLGCPDDFAPERWVAGLPQLRESFMPFGAGPRSCIAQSFASTQVHELVGLLCARYSFELVTPPVAHTTDVCKPVGGRLLIRRVDSGPTGPSSTSASRGLTAQLGPPPFDIVVHSQSDDGGDGHLVAASETVSSTRRWGVWGGSPSSRHLLARPHGWR